MSEFSAGTLIKSHYKDKVLASLSKNEYLIQLQNSWLCKVSEYDMKNNYIEMNTNLSCDIPLLHIIHAEDHGFYCHILYKQKSVFMFDIPSELEPNFDMHIGDELYGDDYVERAFIKREEEVLKKVADEKNKRSHELEAQRQKIFEKVTEESINQFRLFEIEEDIIQQLQKIITIETYKKDNWGHQLVKEFREALGLNSFEWISYEYVSRDSKHYNIINR